MYILHVCVRAKINMHIIWFDFAADLLINQLWKERKGGETALQASNLHRCADYAAH